MRGHLHRFAALSAFAGLTLFSGVASAQTTADQAPALDLGSAIQNGTPIFEWRPRYESVSQAGTADAEAFTMRTRLGWQTTKWNNLVGLIEFEDVRQLGGGDYNDGIGHGAGFATIADPDVTELNRLQLVWTPDDTFIVTAGRQRINLDDQRFIGAAAWRQDEQTFDALRVDADFGRLDVTYAYLGKINRTAAEERDYASDSHILNASYTFADPLKVAGFVYALDLDDDLAAATAEQSSNITYGLRASGNTWVGRFRLNYAASYARQSDYGHYIGNYDLDFYSGEISATLGPTTFRVDYESLEGDGTRGFQTPLATQHIFQGWANAFLTTPANGINDLNGSVIFNPRWRLDHLFNISLLARYHDFETERTGADLGSEVDLSASANITRRLSWIVKYADYDSPGGSAPAARTKTWAGLEFRL